MIIPSKITGLIQLQAIASFIDQGENSGFFIIYDDLKPPLITFAADNNAKLIKLDLARPCLQSSEVDRIQLKPTMEGIATKTGEAVWARLFNGNGIAIADFSIGADIVLNNTSIVLGARLRLDSIVFLVP